MAFVFEYRGILILGPTAVIISLRTRTHARVLPLVSTGVIASGRDGREPLYSPPQDLVEAAAPTGKIWQQGYLWKQSGGAKGADGRVRLSLGTPTLNTKTWYRQHITSH